MPTTKMSPSDVFRRRLRDARPRRRLTQAQLAERLTELGYPFSKTALVRLENLGDDKLKQRDISLDEALAITAALGAVPAHMLTPPKGVELALTSKHVVGAEALRNWLRLGAPALLSGDVPDIDSALYLEGTTSDEAEALIQASFERRVARIAEDIAEANQSGDGAGANEGVHELIRQVLRQEEWRAGRAARRKAQA